MSNNRFKKSQKQLQILQNYYIQYQKWTNQTIHQIEKQSKLPRDKIYKWYWDQNKKLMPKNRQDQPIDVEIQCKGNLLVSTTNQILSCAGVCIDKKSWDLYGDRLGVLISDLVLIAPK
ncbi:hypothetical protein pb186bvf_018390 [Paramecium bursaria]